MAYEIRSAVTTPILPEMLPVELNGDGAIDLIAYSLSTSLHPDNELSILLNAGDGRYFNESAVYTLATSAFNWKPIPEDLNLDGYLDIVVVTDRTIEVFLNDPTAPGSFAPPVSNPLPFDAGQVSIVRLDDDAFPDFVVGNRSGHDIQGLAVLRNNPANPGTFINPSILDTPSQHSVHLETVDVTGDGRLDIVTTSGVGEVVVFRNNTSQPGSFLSGDHYAIPGGVSPFDWLSTADLNGDGAVDIVVPTNDGVAVLLNDSANTGQFLVTNYPSGLGLELTIVEVADWTGDGLLDLVIEHVYSVNGNPATSATVLANQASSPGTFAVPTLLPVQRVFANNGASLDAPSHLTDLNLDGRPDGIDLHGQLLLSDPTTPGGHLPVVNWPENFDNLLPTDLNGDSAIDLLYVDHLNSGWSVAYNDPRNPGQYSTPVETRPVFGLSIRYADLNGDGFPDPITELGNQTFDGMRGIWWSGLSSETTRVDAVVSYQSPLSIIDFGTQFDSDRDGVTDDVETLAPNNGDGNADGIPDLEQGNVASLPSAVDGSYITVDTDIGELVDVRTRQAPANGSPAGFAFPQGLVEYTVEGLNPGTSADVTVTFHGVSNVNFIYKLGATPNNTQEHYYQFANAFAFCQPNCPATFNGNQVTLHLQDGARGDDDLQANGRIVDPMGVAVQTRPTLDVNGPESGVRGQPLEFRFDVTPAGEYTYDIDWDGDGNVDESTSGNETLVVKHVYPSEGDFSVIVTATGADDVSSDPVTQDVSIEIAALIDGNLVVGGTTGHDHIRFYRSGHNRVSVRLNRDRLGPFTLSADAQLVAYGQDGNDRISVSGNLPYDASFFGGAGRDLLVGGRGDDLLDGGPGRDQLYGLRGDDLLDGGDGDDLLFGGLGDNVLVGGEGNDRLLGGFGRDILIGGLGEDRLYGGFGGDILIGGSTVYDDDLIRFVKSLPCGRCRFRIPSVLNVLVTHRSLSI